MPKITVDLETRSAVNLRDCGAHVYAIDPTTQILCLVFAVDDGEPQLWLPGDVLRGENTPNSPPAIFSTIANDPDNWEVGRAPIMTSSAISTPPFSFRTTAFRRCPRMFGTARSALH